MLEMKKRYFIMLCICVCCLLTGCEKEKISYENTYVAGQDFQYMYYGSAYEFGLTMAETEEGYYKLMENYILYTDKETMKTVPLCGKTDCLHEKETDPKKKENCNAYVDTKDGFLYLCQNKLYTMKKVYEEDQNQTTAIYFELYEISLDGSKRNKVCTLKEDNVELWLIHRGKMYFDAKQQGKDEKMHPVLKSVDLKSGKIEEIIFLEDLYDGMVQDFQAYGNYVYVYISGLNREVEETEEAEDWADAQVDRWLAIHIQTGEVKELFAEAFQKEKKYPQFICFWQDHLYYDYTDANWKTRKKSTVYKCDLEGEQEEEWMTIDSHYKYTADEEYFYLYNTWKDSVAEGKEEAMAWVYDKQGKEIDTYAMPNAGPHSNLTPGSKDKFWGTGINEDGTEAALIYEEKGKMGTHKGEPLKMQICYRMEFNKNNTTVEED